MCYSRCLPALSSGGSEMLGEEEGGVKPPGCLFFDFFSSSPFRPPGPAIDLIWEVKHGIGDDRARTDNPRLAKPVLSQLSYVPGWWGARGQGRWSKDRPLSLSPAPWAMGVPRFELGTSALSELRSNQLSYTPACANRRVVDHSATPVRRQPFPRQKFGVPSVDAGRPRNTFIGNPLGKLEES